MKTLYALAIVCSMLFSSCNKKSDVAPTHNAITEGLTGTWKWVKTDGCIANSIHDTPASTGKHIELHFSNNGGYVIYTNAALTSQGTYSLSTGTCIHDHTSKTIIDFSVTTDNDMMIERMENFSLETSDNVYDGTLSMYNKN